MPLIRTQVQFYDKQHEWLKYQAFSKGVSLSQLLRDMVDTYRANVESDREISRKKKDALSIVGKFSSKHAP